MFPADALLAAAMTLMDAGAARHAAADTTYGRIDGDMAIRGALGVVAGARGPRGAADLRLRYLQSAGIFLTYEEGFGGDAAPARVLAGGLELRPLFLGRWLTGHELGSPRVDLLIDSLALELGAFAAQPPGRGFASVGGLSFGLGLEFPLLPRASGPLLGVHATLRWSDGALSGADPSTPEQRAFVVSFVVAWQQIFGGHAVDVGDTLR